MPRLRNDDVIMGEENIFQTFSLNTQVSFSRIRDDESAIPETPSGIEVPVTEYEYNDYTKAIIDSWDDDSGRDVGTEGETNVNSDVVLDKPTYITETYTIEYIETVIINEYDQTELAQYASEGWKFYVVYTDGTEDEIEYTEVVSPIVPIQLNIVTEGEEVALATHQHFWNDDNGVHVTNDTKKRWEEAAILDFSDYSDSSEYNNILLNSFGMLIRSKLNNFASLTRSGVTFYDGEGNQQSNILSYFGSSGAIIGKQEYGYLQLTNKSFQMYDSKQKIYLDIHNLQGSESQASYTDTFVGGYYTMWPDGTKHDSSNLCSSFVLSVKAKNIISATLTEGNTVTELAKDEDYRFSSFQAVTLYGFSYYGSELRFDDTDTHDYRTINEGAILTVTYSIDADFTKAYTFGRRRADTLEGFNSHVLGYGCTASDSYSYAEGYGTRSDGKAAHAEGALNWASGNMSHAEGFQSCAKGEHSHAEGYGTKASGENSHAEGLGSEATEKYSHAEGYKTNASGESSHAEGRETKASGKYSHAQGYGSAANGLASYAVGSASRSDGYGSFAGGHNTLVSDKATDSFVYGYRLASVTAHQTVLGVSCVTDYTNKTVGNSTSLSSSAYLASALALIVGGGNKYDYSGDEGLHPYTSKSRESTCNILELDWDGNLRVGISGSNGSWRSIEYGGTYGTVNGAYLDDYGINGAAIKATGITPYVGKDQLIIGTYNKSDANSAFVIGNGASDSSRSNAFSVYKDGTVYATGNIYNRFNQILGGAYQPSATTVPGLINEVRTKTFCCGSANLSSYTLSSITTPAGWYNFLWIPHRGGGILGGDNPNYGTLLLFGMNVDTTPKCIRVSGSAAVSMKQM